jgi:hypothetical protein
MLMIGYVKRLHEGVKHAHGVGLATQAHNVDTAFEEAAFPQAVCNLP